MLKSIKPRWRNPNSSRFLTAGSWQKAQLPRSSKGTSQGGKGRNKSFPNPLEQGQSCGQTRRGCGASCRELFVAFLGNFPLKTQQLNSLHLFLGDGRDKWLGINENWREMNWESRRCLQHLLFQRGIGDRMCFPVPWEQQIPAQIPPVSRAAPSNPTLLLLLSAPSVWNRERGNENQLCQGRIPHGRISSQYPIP